MSSTKHFSPSPAIRNIFSCGLCMGVFGRPFPSQGWDPHRLQWKCGVLSTGPPEKFLDHFFLVYFGYFAFPAQLFVFCVLNDCLFFVVCLLTLFSIYFSLTPSQTLCLLSEFSLKPLSHIRYSIQFIFLKGNFPERSDPFHRNWLPTGTQVLRFPSLLTYIVSPMF